jgi:hypothetical protein
MTYADEAHFRTVCEIYGVVPPPPRDAVIPFLLAQASRDIDRYLGARYDVADVSTEQAEALRDACAMQAAFRVEQGPLMLGTDDGVASYGDVSMSMRSIPRLSPEAADRLAGEGLYARSGTVEPDPLLDA